MCHCTISWGGDELWELPGNCLALGWLSWHWERGHFPNRYRNILPVPWEDSLGEASHTLCSRTNIYHLFSETVRENVNSTDSKETLRKSTVIISLLPVPLLPRLCTLPCSTRTVQWGSHSLPETNAESVRTAGALFTGDKTKNGSTDCVSLGHNEQVLVVCGGVCGAALGSMARKRTHPSSGFTLWTCTYFLPYCLPSPKIRANVQTPHWSITLLMLVTVQE
jgi:hypothetical protein